MWLNGEKKKKKGKNPNKILIIQQQPEKKHPKKKKNEDENFQGNFSPKKYTTTSVFFCMCVSFKSFMETISFFIWFLSLCMFHQMMVPNDLPEFLLVVVVCLPSFLACFPIHDHHHHHQDDDDEKSYLFLVDDCFQVQQQQQQEKNP